MGINVLKKELESVFHFKKVYPFTSSYAIEMFITNEEYSKYLSSDRKYLNVNIPNEVTSSDFREFRKSVAINLKGLMSMLYEKIGNTYFHRSLKSSLNELKSNTKEKKVIQKEMFENNFYTITEEVDIICSFARTKEDLYSFFNQREFYCFDEDSGKVKVEISRPILKIKKIIHNIEKTQIELSFIFEVFGKKLTENDMYFYNNKYYFENIFNTESDLINFKVSEYESRINYLKNFSTKKVEGIEIKSKSKFYKF